MSGDASTGEPSASESASPRSPATADSPIREGLRDGLRIGDGAASYHRLAVGSVAVLMATSVSVLYHVTDIVGGTGTLTALVAGTLVVGTLLARRLSPRHAALVAGGLLAVGLAGYYMSVPSAYLVAVSFGKVLADNVALLTGLSVLRMTEVGAWALGVAPALVFAPWYLVLRRRYALAVAAGGAALVFFVLSGDAGSFVTLVGTLAATAALGFGTLARRGGTPEQVDAIAVVLVTMVVLSSTVSVVPGGATSPILPGGGSGTPTVEDAFVTNQDRLSVVGSIRLSPKVRFTVEADQSAYWRVGAYDRYDGDGWIRTGDPRDYGVQQPPPGPSLEIEQTVSVEAERMDAMPAAWRPLRLTDGDRDNVRVGAGGSFDPVGSLREGETYSVVSRAPAPERRQLQTAGTDYPARVEDRYLQLPGSSADRIADRTDEITADASTPYEEAVAIERWLESNKRYSLDVDRPDGNIAESFIFDMEQGYCTYYATSMVTMLRSQGVPARFVVGYTPGQQVAEDEWVVRGLDSHAWVEAYFPGVGWVQFDPTPGGPRESAENEQVEQAREGNVSNVDTDESEDGTWTPSTTEMPDIGEANDLTTQSGENGTTDSSVNATLAGGRGQLEPVGAGLDDGNVEPVTSARTDATTASKADSDDGGLPLGLPSREQTVLGAIALVGLLAAARRTGALGRAQRAVWLRWQPRRDPEADVERAFARLEGLLADEHRERDPGETPRQYLSAMAIRGDLDDRAERVGRIYERVRYAGEVEDELAEEAVSLVDELVAERRGLGGR
ncbi:transglutaminase TgpA family protein [Halorussus litoreus]|uniref:transglutaminase TgpA family protein n=1 Tax=Halorussus litoreus TaxID=1710536 RepID=UPI000E289FAB|nr:transglutaminaseTgpA domain-containing protein [Halorussus litoreus]